jgi:hypothetical protein
MVRKIGSTMIEVRPQFGGMVAEFPAGNRP